MMQEAATTRRTFLECLAAAGGLAAIPELALASEANVSPAPATDAEVGSLYPFIESQALHGPASMSFVQPQFHDVAKWKKEARGKLCDLLHYAPPAGEPKAEVVKKIDRGEYVQEKIYFNTTPDLRVPAYVLIPKNAKRPAPAIVALHDHGGFYLWGAEKLIENDREHATITDHKKTYYGGNSIAAVLARRGYVVIVIDMFYWGERRLIRANEPADWLDRPLDMPRDRVMDYNIRSARYEDIVGRTILAAGFTWSAVMYTDDVRAVDYLVTRPEVDPNRIGCVGLSVGGLRSCHLAALDDRIKAAVVVGWMTSFPAQLKRHIVNTIGHTMLVPGLYKYLDYPDVASLAMPSALMVINGSKDALFAPEGVRSSFDTLAECYRKAGIPEKLNTRLFDTPHEFNAGMQKAAWAWLGKWV